MSDIQPTQTTADIVAATNKSLGAGATAKQAGTIGKDDFLKPSNNTEPLSMPNPMLRFAI